jgi:pimeloyl-ACP methyl ester carboxylesterase
MITSTLSDGAIERSVVAGETAVTYIDSVGEGDGRTPLVLVHGTGGRPDTHFNYIFPMLATRGRVIAVQLTDPADRAASGRSIEISDYAEQIAGVIADAAPGQRVPSSATPSEPSPPR